MYDKVHEKISVNANFKPGEKPHILSFSWQEKDYKVKEVTLINKARKGREVIWLFYVVTETMAFKLRLDTDSLTWWLEELTWDEDGL